MILLDIAVLLFFLICFLVGYYFGDKIVLKKKKIDRVIRGNCPLCDKPLYKGYPGKEHCENPECSNYAKL